MLFALTEAKRGAKGLFEILIGKRPYACSLHSSKGRTLEHFSLGTLLEGY